MGFAMVVTDYSVPDDNQTRHLLNEDTIVNAHISNFCPRLRPAIHLLQYHKVGPLQQRVHLSGFQSSTASSLSTKYNSSSFSAQRPCYDIFVLGLPYFCEDMSMVSSLNYMVRWLVIAQCERPDKAPEIILLGMDDSSMVLGELPLRRPYGNHRNQHRQYQSQKITQERYWQQYVASDAFHIQCLTKWGKMNDNTSLSQYCLLADQLYECYTHFQVYKLKVALKSTLSHPPSQLLQASAQFKQLSKLSKLKNSEVDIVNTDISVELFIDLDSGNNAIDYENNHNQISSAIVCIRTIISMVSFEPAEPSLRKHSEITDSNNDCRMLLNLASVMANFPPTGSTSRTSLNKSATIQGTNDSLNKNYLVRILNQKLCRTTQQGNMMTMMLDCLSKKCLETEIDFVTFVRQVQHIAIQSYNYEISSQENDNDDNSIQLLLEALNEVFCSASNGNCLIDYQISNYGTNNWNSTRFIRFLLVDSDLITETTQLKYILTIELNKDIFKECSSTLGIGDTNQITINNLFPVVALRSIYDDENSEHNLNIDISDIIAEPDKMHVKYNELATVIKNATVSCIHQLRHQVITPILTRYNKQWAPSDDYFMSTLKKSPK